jgi:hypothetical protein
VDLVREYWNDVFQEFLEDIKGGLTPNPDIGCNIHIKFESMKHHAFRSFENSTHLATGHYARLIRNDAGNLLLLRGEDKLKDQTYFLAGLTPSLLNQVIFPNGGLSKVTFSKTFTFCSHLFETLLKTKTCAILKGNQVKEYVLLEKRKVSLIGWQNIYIVLTDNLCLKQENIYVGRNMLGCTLLDKALNCLGFQGLFLFSTKI